MIPDAITLVDFIDLTNEEHAMILSWRNDARIKQWMYTTHDISWQEHTAFVNSLKERADAFYFLVKQDGKGIAVLDFTDYDPIEKSIYFGLYADPELKYPGIGRVLETIALEYACEELKVNTLRLELFSENIVVRNLHKKHGFTEIAQKVMNDKKVIVMERTC